MAEVFERMGRLGSFVFFNRDVKERSESSRMIRTIAYHLARHRKDIAVAIRSSMEQHSHIINSGLDLQFQRLLVEPLIKLQLRDHLVIIIDALDEGGNGLSQDAFLTALSSGLRRLPNYVRVMVTSRRYPRIERVFANMDGLHIIDLDRVSETNDDIRKYILARMVEIQSEHHLPQGWPGTGHVDALVQQANGLFIWATVACSYIQSYKPEIRIKTILSNPSVRARAEQTLNDLYKLAFRDADAGSGAWDDDDFATDMHNVASADILGIDRPTALVDRLRSILKKDEEGLVHVRSRCFHVPYRGKWRKGPATPYSEQPFYETLPDSVTYASVSWVYHICMVNPSVNLPIDMLGRSRNAIDWFDKLQEWYSRLNSSPNYDPSFSGMLYDGWRFVKAFSKTIESDPSLLCETALQFCPKNTAISAMFNKDQAVSVVAGFATLTISKSGDAIVAGCVDGTLNVWNATLGTEIFAVEEDPPNALRTRGLIYAQLVSDGKRLLCGLLLGELCILNVDTGNIGTAMDIRDVGDDMKIRMNCASLAPDDRTVVCGFEDGMMQLWDTEVQVQLTPLLVGHEEAINTIVFSHDQQRFISGSDDRTIRLWSRMCEHERTFLGHNGAICCVAFSPDDSKIASASLDETMKIWDTLTGEVLFTCRHRTEEAVYAVAFSNKGDRVATATYHWKIRIWDSVTGEEVMPPLSLHQGPVRALVFAPDDKTLISGGQDSHVRVWSMVNTHPHGESVQPAQTNEVNCVALSHDKTRFVSGSADTSIIVWNTLDGCASFPPLRGHEAEVVSVDFSKDDRMFASASKDGQICLWDTATGQSLGPPLTLTDEIWTVKFSADGSRLAVTTKPHALTVWSIHDRRILFGPLPHPDCYWPAIAFSNQGAKLATLYSFSESSGESILGFGITVRDATLQGDVIFKAKIDSEVEGWEMYGVQMEYTADDRYLVVWYSLSP
ncbi:WD40-repeat-containing domain protein [Mycena latifolia]|nr:WD40-repeat-containing domain protein [Mycena latifolia]